MKRLLATLITIFGLQSHINAQTFEYAVWREGRVHLNNGEVHIGKINYDYELNMLIVKTDKRELTYVVNDIYKFELDEKYLGDGITLSKRVYFTIYDENRLGIKVPSFYRVVLGGEVSVLTKGFKYDTDADFDKPQFYIKDESYLYFRDGRIEKAKSWRKNVIEQLGGDEEMLMSYIKSERLVMWRPFDLARLVQFYNNNRDS